MTVLFYCNKYYKDTWQISKFKKIQPRLFVTESVRYGTTLKWIQIIPEEYHWPQPNLESEPLNHPPYDLRSIILSGKIINIKYLILAYFYRSPHSTPSKSPARDIYGDRFIGIRPSSGARARLDFSEIESPNSKQKNKENQNESNSQTNREKLLYQSLLQNELQGIWIIPFASS